MILTALYHVEQLRQSGKTRRLDCTSKAGTCALFDNIAASSKTGAFWCYLMQRHENFTPRAKANPLLTFNDARRTITSLWPLHGFQHYFYGDVRETNDALLAVFNDGFTACDIYIVAGGKMTKAQLCQELANGRFADDVARLKREAQSTGNARVL